MCARAYTMHGVCVLYVFMYACMRACMYRMYRIVSYRIVSYRIVSYRVYVGMHVMYVCM